MRLPLLRQETAPAIGSESPSEQLIEWSLRRFGHQKLALTTGFGLEGCALIDMYAAFEMPLDVIYLDTMFFFDETYRLIERMRRRYPHLEFVNRGTALSPQEQARAHGPELWKRDPDLCCRLRKVDPMVDALRDVDVWVTALRRGQAPTRANLGVIEWNWRYQVLKISPLATWTRQQVQDYVERRGVPYNPLHDRGFPSIGCTHCTRPVAGLSAGAYSRAGRWSGIEKTECGLHE